MQDTTRNFEALYKELEAEHDKSKTASKSLEERNKKLESELRDARDNSELLEFRLLELEQRESRERSPDMVRKLETAAETVMMTPQDDGMSQGAPDSGCSGSLASLDDLLESQTDFRVSLINCVGNFPKILSPSSQFWHLFKQNGFSLVLLITFKSHYFTYSWLAAGLLLNINSDSYLG